MMQDSIEHRIALVRALPLQARRASLDAALGACSDPCEHTRLAIELLELAIRPGLRPHAGPWARRSAYLRQSHADVALSLMCAHWVSLSTESRSHVICIASGRLARVARDLLHDDDPLSRSAACGLALASGEPSLVAGLSELIEDESEIVQRDANEALLLLAARLLEIDEAALLPDLVPTETHVQIVDLDDHAYDALVASLRRAMARYPEHQRRGVALACLMMVAHDPKLGSLVSPRIDHASTQALRGVLRWSRSPISRVCALRLLDHPILGEAASKRLSRGHDLGDHDHVLALGHLTLNPCRRAALGQIRVRVKSTPLAPAPDGSAMVRLTMPKESPLPDGSWLGSLSPQSRRQIPRWLEAMDTDPPTAQALLGPMLGDRDDLARLLASRVVSDDALPDFCLDPREEVASSSCLRLSLQGVAHEAQRPIHRRHLDTLATLARSPHARVRRLAREDLARLDPWSGSGPSQALIARRRMIDDPEALLIDLRHVLMSASALDRLRAIALADRLGIVHEIESLLISLVTQPHGPGVDERVIASATGALGSLQSTPAIQTVRLALRHSDARVRANAVESMARQERRRAPVSGEASGDAELRSTLTELRGDVHQRVRANAVRALMELPEPKGGAALYTPSASSALISMLRDPRAAHRISGLWVAERTSRPEPPESLIDHLRSLGEMDPDPGARARANRVIHRVVISRELAGSSSGPGSTDNTRSQSGLGWP